MRRRQRKGGWGGRGGGGWRMCGGETNKHTHTRTHTHKRTSTKKIKLGHVSQFQAAELDCWIVGEK